MDKEQRKIKGEGRSKGRIKSKHNRKETIHGSLHLKGSQLKKSAAIVLLLDVLSLLVDINEVHTKARDWRYLILPLLAEGGYAEQCQQRGGLL